jgi:hypothetical protein
MFQFLAMRRVVRRTQLRSETCKAVKNRASIVGGFGQVKADGLGVTPRGIMEQSGAGTLGEPSEPAVPVASS